MGYFFFLSSYDIISNKTNSMNYVSVHLLSWPTDHQNLVGIGEGRVYVFSFLNNLLSRILLLPQNTDSTYRYLTTQSWTRTNLNCISKRSKSISAKRSAKEGTRLVSRDPAVPRLSAILTAPKNKWLDCLWYMNPHIIISLLPSLPTFLTVFLI